MKNIALVIAALVVVAAAGLVGFLVHDKNSTNKGMSSNHTSESDVSNSQSEASNSKKSSAGQIEIADNMIFTPSQISVQEGDTVTWTNNDDTEHTVTADLKDNGGPSSGIIKPGETYSFTFTKSGSFQYHCEIHSEMRGTIVVK